MNGGVAVATLQERVREILAIELQVEPSSVDDEGVVALAKCKVRRAKREPEQNGVTHVILGAPRILGARHAQRAVDGSVSST